MVAKYDSGDLTPENNCVDILLCEKSLKAFVLVQALVSLSLPLCKSQLNLPKALWGGKKGGDRTGTEQHSIYPVMIVKRRENGPNGSMYST